ncbi:Eco57I restriction-modification methylase domain-containing protein [Haladaptatus sp. ZSTT2]|uniref:Eco57I restriction-modification methylase domain-containing protein n=1 Tax=Haladaptatus sp. ZSTT2 TaxID=3120515 RepID=UPI00300EE52B
MSESPSPTVGSRDDFVETVISEYSDLYSEIEEGERAEHDLMPRVVDHLFIEALGWEKSDYQQEDDWNDVRFFDEDRNPVVIVEGKRRGVNVDKGIDQVFRYASETPYARYLISTNVDSMHVYERCDGSNPDAITCHDVSAKLVTKIPFEGICNRVSGGAISDELSLDEKQRVKRLFRLRKEEVTHADRYSDFTLGSRQDVDNDDGFDNLIDTLRLCLEDYLFPYTLSAFDKFESRYEEFERERSELEEQIERLEESGHDDTEIAELEDKLAELKDDYEIYNQFHSDYETWVRLSNRQDNEEDENKEVFCRESVYVQLNKILLIRIAEDKDLVNQMVSNGGVHRYFEFWDDYTRYVDRDYIDLFETASEELSEVYDYLYSRRLFDWGIQSDSELDNVLQRTLWHLNHYDFENVDRDVLGHLYQEHLPPEERKALGEFYTPVAVVDLILDSVGYTTDKQLEKEQYDLIDPACGSGTFLVRAAKRLLERLDKKGVPPRDAIEIVQERIHGLDLNPFACHIAELNLLFQVIDLYKEVKDDNPDYTLDRFHIYRTDSLRAETQESLTAMYSSELQRQYREERKQAASVKMREDYGFVVGNPPYVRIQNIPKGPARDEYDEYDTAHYNYDIYILFMERAAQWLAEDGTLGFIISNKFTENRYGAKIQDYLLQNYHINEIINFGDVSVFEGVQSYPMIFIGDRINKNSPFRSSDDFELKEDYSFTYAGVTEELPEITQTALNGANGDRSSSDAREREKEGGKIAELIRASMPKTPGGTPPTNEELMKRITELAPDAKVSQPPLQVYPMKASMLLAADEWQFIPQDEHEVMEAMEDAAREFGEYDGSVANNGVQTGSNDIFVIDEATIEEYGIEDEVVHPTLGGRDVVRWHTNAMNKYILYTTPDTNLDELDGAREYLEDNRDGLEERYCVTDNRRKWYELAEYRPGVFDKNKVVTPDICYYNNFFNDEDGDFYSLNSTYVMFSEELASDYLVGVLNSDPVQFYMRRTAPQYGNDYLRYITSYLFKIPIPDPAEADDSVVQTVVDAATDLKELSKGYQEAKEIVATPELVFELEDVDRSSMSFAGYIESMNLSGGDADVSPNIDGTTIRLNVQDTIEFVNENVAEAFATLIQLLEVKAGSDLKELDVPSSEEELFAVVDALEAAAERTEADVKTGGKLEEELNEAVFELYGFSEEHRELILERVDKPENPLDAKVR